MATHASGSSAPRPLAVEPGACTKSPAPLRALRLFEARRVRYSRQRLRPGAESSHSP
jgi:hypothetical protein